MKTRKCCRISIKIFDISNRYEFASNWISDIRENWKVGKLCKTKQFIVHSIHKSDCWMLFNHRKWQIIARYCFLFYLVCCWLGSCQALKWWTKAMKMFSSVEELKTLASYWIFMLKMLKKLNFDLSQETENLQRNFAAENIQGDVNGLTTVWWFTRVQNLIKTSCWISLTLVSVKITKQSLIAWLDVEKL